MLLMLIVAFKCNLDNQMNECLVMIGYMLRLSTAVPDYRISIMLFRLQGEVHRTSCNLSGAITSFQSMRNAAEDIGDGLSETEAYYQAGITFTHKNLRDYEAALKTFRRMLQVAWFYNIRAAEIKAYDNIGKMCFYLS